MSDFQLFTVTGPLGTGKSTTARLLESMLVNAGRSVANIGDYELVKQWAREHPEWNQWWKAGDEFLLKPEAYVIGGLSEFTASKLGRLALEKFQQGTNVVILEVARGAGKPPDNYGGHFFGPLLKVISQSSDPVSLWNLELWVENLSLLEGRVKKRFEGDPSAPPPESVWRYFDDEGNPNASSVYAVREMMEMNLFPEVPVALNTPIDNGSEVQEGSEALELALRGKLPAWLLEGQPPRGKEERP